MVEAGYEGTEYGAGLPEDPEALRPLLKRHGLTLASNFCWVALYDGARQAAEIERALGVARTLSALEVSELILGIRGDETFDVTVPADIKPQQRLTLVMTRQDGSRREIPVLCRIDTPIEVDYYRHGGILPFVLRELIRAA
jgi:sugar phosphate isomerase/epimerase